MKHQDLDDFFQSIDWEKVSRINDWKVTKSNELITFHLKARDEENYIVQFLCDNYPTSAPSVLFVNETGDKTDKLAWPTGDNDFLGHIKPPPNCFICMPLTLEGLQHHRDWVNNPSVDSWDPNKHSLLDIMNFLQRRLKSNHYLGRGR